jgi:hypothetical protein
MKLMNDDDDDDDDDDGVRPAYVHVRRPCELSQPLTEIYK